MSGRHAAVGDGVAIGTGCPAVFVAAGLIGLTGLVTESLLLLLLLLLMVSSSEDELSGRAVDFIGRVGMCSVKVVAIRQMVDLVSMLILKARLVTVNNVT